MKEEREHQKRGKRFYALLLVAAVVLLVTALVLSSGPSWLAVGIGSFAGLLTAFGGVGLYKARGSPPSK
ncbi:hypothetical protein ACFXPA_25490 [Amycolatopsis sp. NPDC059090]|uniref:hypothetical protein n=1 Tax=unclassified Amycolatopsis TaxID=2618356 RepID=UPI00366AD666